MALRFNPFTGQFDVAGGTTARWAFNPFTGKLDRDSNAGGYVFNPFTGNLDSAEATVAPPAPTQGLEWSASSALEWDAGNDLYWG